MGQAVSSTCCSSDSNVHFPDEPEKQYVESDATAVRSPRRTGEVVPKPFPAETRRPSATRKDSVRVWEPVNNETEISLLSTQVSA